MSTDLVEQFKVRQRETWTLGNFADMAVFTAAVAGHLVRFAGVSQGQTVLDVGTGTGVVAITARRCQAQVTGLDLTPALLEMARGNSLMAELDDIVWLEGDVEVLPFPDACFDVVLSQFGHMFAPRPDVALKEMLRVLKPNGTIAFATWPGEQLIGRQFSLMAKYVPPLQGFVTPVLWGDVSTIQQRLGDSIKKMHMERGVMAVPTLSAKHWRLFQEAKAGPFIRTVQALQKDLSKLTEWRNEMDAMINEYLEDNIVRHEYLLTRAIKI